MNWLIIIVVGILAIALIIFLVIRDQKDKKEFIDELNEGYSKAEAEEGDIESDELTNSVHYQYKQEEANNFFNQIKHTQ